MRRLLAVFLLAFVCAAGVYAQAVAGSGAVTGIVRDIYGDGIPEVTLVLSNPALGIARTMMTSDDGLFAAPSLAPSSTYSLKVTKKGYADWQLKNFDVSIGETVNFRIPLVKADAADSQADPRSALTPVQDTKTSLATLITDGQLTNLPVNGRALDNLVILAPTVTMEPSTGVLAFRGQTYTNSVLVDGINVSNNFYERQPGVAPNLSMDTILEFQVLSAAATAEFGHGSGGVVNTATRSGTNDFHVSAYDYYNSHSMNAPDPLDTAFKPTGKRQQAGISLGTPIAPDRFFFFGNFERVTDDSQGLNRITNPLLTDSTGNNVLVSNCTSTAAQCASAATFIKSQMNVVVPRSLHSTTGFAKFDLRPSEAVSITMEGNLAHRNSPNGADVSVVSPNNGLLGSNASLSGSTEFAKFGFIDVPSGNAANEFRGSWYKDTLNSTENFALTPSTGPVAINVAGTPLGANPRYPSFLTQQRISVVDAFTLTIAANTIKLGADFTSAEDRMDQLYARYGEYDYGSLTAFANDFSANVKQTKNYNLFRQTFGNPVSSIRTMGIHAYAHDTWKATSRLLINGGLRWEKERIPRPTEPNPLTYQSGFIPSPNTDYAPRVGLAYLLDNRTVVRIGVGSYFEPFVGQLVRDLTVGAGVYQTGFTLIPTTINAPVFPKPLAATTTVAANLINQVYAEQKFRNPYTEQGSAGIERRLNAYLALALSFTESRGVKLWTIADQNLLGATNTAKTYAIDDANGAQTGTYNANIFSTNFAQHLQVENAGSSTYKAAVAQLRTATIHGFSAQASYTWSHNKDDVDGPTVLGSVVRMSTSPGNYGVDTADSALDQRHRVVVNWMWQPRIAGATSTAARLLVNGWVVSGTVMAASSMHDTPLALVSGQQFAGLVMAEPTSLNGSGGWQRVPFQGINTLPIGKQFNVDARVSKQLAFTDRLKATLLVEAFNATNHKNYSGVQDIAYLATSGVLRPVPGLGTPNAAFGYPFGTSARRAQVALRLEF